jgi:hypothetical protein
MVGGPTIFYPPRQPFWGRVGERGFSMKVRLTGRNSFQSEVRGRWTRSADGKTDIHLVAGVSRSVLAFMFLFNVVGFWIVARLWRAGAPMASPLEPILACLFPPAATVALYVFGRWCAREEEDTIIRVLFRTLRCDPPAPDQSQGPSPTSVTWEA